MSKLPGILAMALAIGQSDASVAHFRMHGNIPLNDPNETPGVIRTTDWQQICKGGSTKQFRHTTESTKKHVCLEYGLKPHCWGVNKAEIDHLLPLELGGEDNIVNLWPEPAPSYHWKDKLENALHRKVCITKALNIKEAQACIMSDWVACYEKEIGPLPTARKQSDGEAWAKR